MEELKGYEKQKMSLLDLDNEFSTSDNLSLFGCGEGRECIEELFKNGKSDFSYEWGNTDCGICVEFKMADESEKPDSLDYEDVKNVEVIIVDIYAHYKNIG